MTTAEIHYSRTVDNRASDPADGLSPFTEIRPRLFAIACRMLQSSAEAEDVVQDVWLRWQQTNRSLVQDVPAFLAKTTTRLCLNIAYSARSRCETVAGPWFSEPVDPHADPELGAIHRAGLKRAIKMLLERLSPSERAAYILREAFSYSYRQIADVLRLSEANSRQLFVRARKHLAERRRASATRIEYESLLGAFIHAAKGGSLTKLEILLAKEVATYADVSERPSAASHWGIDDVAEVVAATSSTTWSGEPLGSQVSWPLGG